MERLELVNMVRRKIDEVAAADTPLQAVTIADENSMDTIIESLLDESAREILLKAPIYRLKVTSATPSAQKNSSDSTTGYIQVPEDFLRLVSMRMSDWQRPVVQLALQGDAVAMRQSNRHIRGGVAKPVGVLAKNEKGIVVEYYSTNAAEHSVSEFLYIKSDTAENIKDAQMIDALTWICAGKTLSVMGNMTQAQNAYDNAQSLMI